LVFCVYEHFITVCFGWCGGKSKADGSDVLLGADFGISLWQISVYEYLPTALYVTKKCCHFPDKLLHIEMPLTSPHVHIRLQIYQLLDTNQNYPQVPCPMAKK